MNALSSDVRLDTQYWALSSDLECLCGNTSAEKGTVCCSKCVVKLAVVSIDIICYIWFSHIFSISKSPAV